MLNYSNFCRDLRNDLSEFLSRSVYPVLNKSQKKCMLDLIWGILKTGSIMISEIARALNESQPLIYTEMRLTNHLVKDDYIPAREALQTYAINHLLMLPYQVNVDETDIIKPYGFAFEDLAFVHDASKQKRPIEKGYFVTAMVGIGFNKTVIPLVLDIYSTKSPNFTSTGNRTKHLATDIFPSFPTTESRTFTFDRGYDDTSYFNFFNEHQCFFVIRAKHLRGYMTRFGHETLAQILARTKGKYGATFIDQEGNTRYVKVSSVPILHPQFSQGYYLVIECFHDLKDKRAYVTNIDCSTRDGCFKALKCYRMRWRIEEYFRFIKQEFAIEHFRVRSIKAMNNLMLMVNIIVTYLSAIIIDKNSVYYHSLAAYRSFADALVEEDIKLKYHEAGLMLYRMKRGLGQILQHANTLPKVPGRDRHKKKYEQLRLL
ncbi:MAG: transposase [Bacilli bacterium]|nr:transposase [Bacilli bacterium]